MNKRTKISMQTYRLNETALFEQFKKWWLFSNKMDSDMFPLFMTQGEWENQFKSYVQHIDVYNKTAK